MRITLLLGLALAALIALRSPARADGDVGVIVTGEGSMQPQLAAQLADWLSRHGQEVRPVKAFGRISRNLSDLLSRK